MSVYAPPVDLIRFLLGDVLDYPGRVGSLPGHEETDLDLVVDLLEGVGTFCSDVLAPLNPVGDQVGLRLENGVVVTPPGFRDAYRRYVDDGWSALAGDLAFGGAGLPEVVRIAVAELVCGANLSFSTWMLLTEGALHALHLHASEEQQARYLPRLTSGEWAGTMCLTEAHAGSDLGLLHTRAVPAEDGAFRLSGTKIFITCGEHDMTENIIHLVLARLPDAPAGTKGISLFVVPKVLADGTRNGVVCEALEHKMGIHASPTCVMGLHEAWGELVGERNGGMRAMFTMMNAARVGVGAQGLGVAEAAYQKAVAYARERLQGRAPGGPTRPDLEADPIIDHPDVRATLMRAAAVTMASRMLLLDTAIETDRALRHPDPAVRAAAFDRVAVLTPFTKAVLTDHGFDSAAALLGVFGGHGYIRDSLIEQHVRDARITSIWEGTNGIQALDLVGRKLGLAGGAAFDSLLAELDAHVTAAGRQSPDLCHPVGGALALARDATARLRAADSATRAAGASDFLRLVGCVILAVNHLRMASAGGVGAKASDRATALARFYVSRVLPETVAFAAGAVGDAVIVTGFDTALL